MARCQLENKSNIIEMSNKMSRRSGGKSERSCSSAEISCRVCRQRNRRHGQIFRCASNHFVIKIEHHVECIRSIFQNAW